MGVRVVSMIPRQTTPSSQTAMYTAANVTSIIDKFTFTNTSGAGVTISVNLPATGQSELAANCVLSAKTIAPGETYTCPELVGQVLIAGGFISVIAGTANALTISASGREIS